MGYRSHVIIGFAFADRAAVDLFGIKLQEPEFSEIRSELVDSMDWFAGEGLIYAVLEFDSIKWYESYSYVQQFERLFAELSSNWVGVAGAKFVRAGEDAGDIEGELHGDIDLAGYLDIYAVNSVACNVGGEDLGNPLGTGKVNTV